jgi:hypothetical protein
VEWFLVLCLGCLPGIAAIEAFLAGFSAASDWKLNLKTGSRRYTIHRMNPASGGLHN